MNTVKLRLAVLSDKTVKGSVRRICESLIEIAENVPEQNLSLIAIEKLSPYSSDIAVKSFVTNEKRVSTLRDMGISGSIDRILNESSVATYPHLKAPISRFKSLSEKSSDYMIVESFLGATKNLLFDPVIKREHDALQKKFESLKEEILVKKHVDVLSSSKNRLIYRGLLEKLENYVFDRSSGSRRLIIQELNKYKFDHNVNSLANALRVMENSKGAFNPLNNGTKCSVLPAIGHVQIGENNDYFLIEGVIFKKNDNDISFVDESEALNNCSSLVEVLNSMKRTGAYILGDSVMIPMGRNTLKITESGEIFMNDEQLTRDQLVHRTNLASIVDRSQIRAMNDALKLHEHASKLMEVDFAKKIVSNIYEGVGAIVVKGDNYLVNFRNPAMNESSNKDFTSARSLRDFVLEKLSYDVSEAFSEVLSREEEVIQKQRKKVSSLMESIVTVERELKKVSKAMLEDESVSNNRNVKVLESSLKGELKLLHRSYNGEQRRLDEMIGAASMPSVGDKVKVGKKGTGTVLSVDGVNRVCIALMEDGQTIKCKHNELSVIDPVIKKSSTAMAEVGLDLIKGSKAMPSDKKGGKGKMGGVKESMIETDEDYIDAIDAEEVSGVNERPDMVTKHPDFGSVYDEDVNRFNDMVENGEEDYNPSYDDDLEVDELSDIFGSDPYEEEGEDEYQDYDHDDFEDESLSMEENMEYDDHKEAMDAMDDEEEDYDEEYLNTASRALADMGYTDDEEEEDHEHELGTMQDEEDEDDWSTDLNYEPDYSELEDVNFPDEYDDDEYEPEYTYENHEHGEEEHEEVHDAHDTPTNSKKLKIVEQVAMLPEGAVIHGDLDLSEYKGKIVLPKGLRVEGDLWLHGCTGLTALPDRLSVGKGLWLSGCTGLTALPEGLRVGGTLYLDGCTGLTALPEGLRVRGDLNLWHCTGLTALPEGLRVKWCLYLNGCTGLTALPEDLSVGENLYLDGCTGLTALPEGLQNQVRGIIYH